MFNWKENKEESGKVISLVDESIKRYSTNPHANHIVLEHEYTPQEMVIQRHLENLEATYGTHTLVEVIKMMGLDDVSLRKVAS